MNIQMEIRNKQLFLSSRSPHLIGPYNNSPVLHSARHQRPTRERHKIRIASRETVDNQAPRNTNFQH